MPAKLTREQRRTLERICGSLDAVLSYLHQDTVVVCTASQGTTTLDYQAMGSTTVRQSLRGCPHDHLSPVAKDIGSPLAQLPEALKEAKALLYPPARPESQMVISDD